MYGYAKVMQLEPIVRAELMWVNVGHFIVQLVFDNELHLTIKNDAVLTLGGKELSRWTDATRWTSTDFQELLGRRVSSFTVVDRDKLEIQFTGGYVLTLHDDPQFESLEAWLPGSDDGKTGPFLVV